VLTWGEKSQEQVCVKIGKSFVKDKIN
jgi:hypothetical protein